MGGRVSAWVVELVDVSAGTLMPYVSQTAHRLHSFTPNRDRTEPNAQASRVLTLFGIQATGLRILIPSETRITTIHRVHYVVKDTEFGVILEHAW